MRIRSMVLKPGDRLTALIVKGLREGGALARATDPEILDPRVTFGAAPRRKQFAFRRIASRRRLLIWDNKVHGLPVGVW